MSFFNSKDSKMLFVIKNVKNAPLFSSVYRKRCKIWMIPEFFSIFFQSSNAVIMIPIDSRWIWPVVAWKKGQDSRRKDENPPTLLLFSHNNSDINS
jgi:hypothetical protein